MLTKNLHVEYWLVQKNGEGKFGPFTWPKEAQDCVIENELHDYEFKTFMSYIPF